MKHMLALAALLLPAHAAMLEACDPNGQGTLVLAPESVTFCHPWPSCTSWTARDTIPAPKLTKQAAQKDKTDSSEVLIEEYDFTADGEFARVHLEEGSIYRVELTTRTGFLQIRPRRSATQPLLPPQIEEIPRASGTQAVEIAPREDGEYDFRVIGHGGAGARLRVFREIRSSQRWQRISNDRS